VEQAFEHSLTGPIVRHEVVEAVALRSRVFGVTAYIQIETGTVLQKDVGASPPRDDPSKEIARHLIGRKTTLAAQSTGHPVFVFHAEDATFHDGEGTGRSFIAAGSPYD